VSDLQHVVQPRPRQSLPINSLQLTWDVQAPPPDWADPRDRWQIAHVGRTGAALLAFAFAFLSAAALSRMSLSSQGETT
jgi:hypothetical protein